MLNRELGVAEVLIVPRSPLIGDTVFPGMTTDSGDLAILAVQRKGHRLGPEPAALATGDVLLVQGTWQALDRNIDPREVRVVDSPGMVRRQAVPLSRGAWSAIAVLAGMVVLLASGVTTPAVAGLLAAGAMICLRVLTMTQAYDAISWTTLVIVAGMLPLSAAIQESGAAERIADLVVAFSGGEGYPLLLGIFLLTAALGQVISNTATTLIVIPIAIAAAQDAGVSPLPVLMCVAIAAAAAFLTPIATAANLMAMEPGGYRFGDYWRLGLPMLLWFLVVAVVIVPLFWPLTP
jgi:di/tricarboxylate transporter